jgi:hypothetical protein
VKSRKSAISVRIGAADVRNVKAVAKRLGVRDSDVFRYAVKSSLEQLGPLGDPNVHGRHLLPVFVEAGPTLLRFFDLDAARLVEIVNAGVEDPEALVAREDLTLLSMAVTQQGYALVKLNELREEAPSLPPETQTLVEALREYLYDKYVFRSPRRLASPGA